MGFSNGEALDLHPGWSEEYVDIDLVYPFGAQGIFGDAIAMDSSDPSVATMSDQQVITAHRNGVTTITVTHEASGAQGHLTVTVYGFPD